MKSLIAVLVFRNFAEIIWNRNKAQLLIFVKYCIVCQSVVPVINQKKEWTAWMILLWTRDRNDQIQQGGACFWVRADTPHLKGAKPSFPERLVPHYQGGNYRWGRGGQCPGQWISRYGIKWSILCWCATATRSRPPPPLTLPINTILPYWRSYGLTYIYTKVGTVTLGDGRVFRGQPRP